VRVIAYFSARAGTPYQNDYHHKLRGRRALRPSTKYDVPQYAYEIHLLFSKTTTSRLEAARRHLLAVLSLPASTPTITNASGGICWWLSRKKSLRWKALDAR